MNPSSSGLPTPSLREAAQRVLEGFDQGIFVRDTGGDSAPGWSLKLLPYVAALAELRAALGEPPPPTRCGFWGELDRRCVHHEGHAGDHLLGAREPYDVGAPPQGSAPDVARSLASQVGDLENEERLLRADVPELWKQIGSLQQSLWAIGEIATHMKLQNGPDWERVCAQADWERMMDLASGGLRPQGEAPPSRE